MEHKLRPLNDWICGKRLDYQHPSLFVYGQRTHRAKIVAAGPGKRLKKWIEVEDPINGKKFRTRAGNETGRVRPLTVKPGEIVEFSNHGWEERIIDGETYVFFREDSIIGYADEEDSEGIQAHNSAIIP